jgi:hypothetical protein
MNAAQAKPKAIVYIDGFNLYQRLVKNTPYKWLNVSTLCDDLLKEYEIREVHYYTARVSAQPHDLEQPMRQEIYFRALCTDSRVQLHFGKFISRYRFFPVYPWEYDSQGKPIKTKVFWAQEKGSDVSLASQIVFDALRNKADAYFILTNDSDQAAPLRLLIENVNADFGILVPEEKPTMELLQLPLKVKRKVRKSILKKNQFPDDLEDCVGKFHKPKGW